MTSDRTAPGYPPVWLCARLIRVRPAELAAILKRLLAIRRVPLECEGGLVFWADPVSDFGIRLLTEGTYEPQMTELVRAVVGPKDCFVDVGANEGWFTVVAAQKAVEGRVLAIEPQSALQEVIEANLRINRVPNAELFHLALSDEAGDRVIHLKPSTNTGASGFYARRFAGRSERVETSALDEFLVQNGVSRVRLLKVDCEGAENLVIRGASKALTQLSIDYLALEYHPGILELEACLRTHEQVLSAGYRLTKVEGQHIYHLPGLHPPLMSLGRAQLDAAWDG